MTADVWYGLIYIYILATITTAIKRKWHRGRFPKGPFAIKQWVCLNIYANECDCIRPNKHSALIGLRAGPISRYVCINLPPQSILHWWAAREREREVMVLVGWLEVDDDVCICVCVYAPELVCICTCICMYVCVCVCVCVRGRQSPSLRNLEQIGEWF